jgi:hypothetical protein
MSINKQKATIFKRRLILWFNIFMYSCLDPIRDKTSFLQALSFPFFIYFIFSAEGFSAVSEQLVDTELAFKAILWAVPAFIVWNAIAAIFKVKEEEEKLGKWLDNCFVYNEPILVYRARVNKSNNNQFHEFKVDQAEPDGYVELEYKFSGFERQRIEAQIVKEINGQKLLMPWQNRQGLSNYVTILTGKDKKFYLAVNAETDNPTIVSVYLNQWSIF